MRGARLLLLIFLLAFLLALPVPFSAQAPTDNALTNADIGRMVKAGIPESIIVREIQMSRTEFGTSPAALIELKKQGASERVLGAVLDSRSGASGPGQEPLPLSHLSAQSAAAAAHHLPSFDAKVKLDSKAQAKISVSQNHIKVEKSGVPLFDLKWKEKRSQ
jgi:hypothetical protein